MIRRIIQIDEEKCNGCGLCAQACHEGAIGMVNGKAKLMREDYCDGLGDCLPACPADAIHFVEREAPAYDAAAVAAGKQQKSAPFVCPSAQSRTLHPAAPASSVTMESQLFNWPVQIKLAPLSAPYFAGADLLIAADCTAYAYAGFHEDFIRGRVTLIGCPKLDGVNYTDKLTDIIASNDIREVLIVRMEVPCCGGLELAAKNALKASGKFIPWNVVTIASDGRIVD